MRSTCGCDDAGETREGETTTHAFIHSLCKQLCYQSFFQNLLPSSSHPHTLSTSTAPIFPITSSLLHLHLQQPPHPSTHSQKRHLTRMPKPQQHTHSQLLLAQTQSPGQTQQRNYRPPPPAHSEGKILPAARARVTYSGPQQITSGHRTPLPGEPLGPLTRERGRSDGAAQG